MGSLDFSAMHPRLAYHLKMIPYSGDPYIIDGYEYGDAYSTAKEWRGYFKTICLVSLNADSKEKAARAILDKFRAKGIARFELNDIKRLIDIFVSQHDVIEEYICNDFGMGKAMFMDARIMADCMNELMIKKGIIVLPEHDEQLYGPDTTEVAEIVEKQMVESYRKILRLALIENGKLNKDEHLPENLVPVIH